MKLDVKIRERCEILGIKTAYQLQKSADLSPATASRLFNNQVKEIPLETLEKLCRALDCDAGVLFPRVLEENKEAEINDSSNA